MTCFWRPALTRANSDGFMPLSGTRAMCRVGMVLRDGPPARGRVLLVGRGARKATFASYLDDIRRSGSSSAR